MSDLDKMASTGVTLCLCVTALLWSCDAYSFFRDEIPNGNNVEHPCKPNTNWNGVGHLVEQGGGARNQFGLAFYANGKKWDRTLCMMDSDGDGQTNGAELGDPDCTWTKGSTPKRTTGITHPGFKTPAAQHTYSSSDPTTIDCGGAATKCPAKQEVGVKTIDLKMAKGTKVPGKTTTYYCTSFAVPSDVPYHAIAFDAILDNLNVIHHMLLYGCDKETVDTPSECDMSASGCRELIAVWSLGLPDQCLPDVAGVRFGNGTYTTFQLQVHWNNPQHTSTYTDESGMRMHYTPTLRQYDMGIMWLGQQKLNIPPLTKNTTVLARCSGNCTQDMFLQDINLSASIVHMHLTGAQGRIIHNSRTRGRSTQILFEEVYDYDSPRWTYHTPEVIIKPGDSLEMQCIYDTSNRTTMTYFGEATNDEMCYGFLQYYPKGGDYQCIQHGNTDLCYSASTVCGTKCPLSIFFDTLTAVVNQGVIDCATVTGDGTCNDTCKTAVNIVTRIYSDKCTQLRHPTVYRAFLTAITPIGARLASLYNICSKQHPVDFFLTPLSNATFTDPAEVSKSCPATTGINRYPPGSRPPQLGSTTVAPTIGNGSGAAALASFGQLLAVMCFAVYYFI